MSVRLRMQTEVRSVARRLGLVGIASRVRSLIPRSSEPQYEERLRTAMEAATHAGDVIWDVGANVGLYTELFAHQVGETGLVCAFEPALACFDAMRERTRALPQVRAFNMALADRDSELTLHVARDPLAATHSLSAVGPHDGSLSRVRAARGDSLVLAGEAPPPNVMKIDVEGFEEEVLLGATEILKRPEFRTVFIEVHFGLLDARGQRHAPARIVEHLERTCGLRTRWLDASHVEAGR